MAMPEGLAPQDGLHRRPRLEIKGGAERPQVVIGHWTPDDIPALTQLERNWAPWLRKPSRRIRAIADDEQKAQTHFIAKIPQTVGSMSVMRTTWNGDPRVLGSWDHFAGGSVEESDYPTYQESGKAFVIMSSSVDSEHQGQGIARALVTEVQRTAAALGIQHIIGPFRPSGYGEYKLKVLKGEKPRISFEDYCEKVIAGSEKDPWLEAAMHMGMTPLRADGRLRVEEHSMTVKVPIKKFNEYRATYKPDKWTWVEEDGVWECDETGSWIVVGEENDPKAFAVYTEPNLWGEIPLLSAVPQQRAATE